MFQKTIIMPQYHINFLHNTKEQWWVLFGSMFYHIMDHLRPKTGNPLENFNCFSLFLLILCLPNVTKTLITTQYKINCIHNTKYDRWVLLGITFYELMEKPRPKMRNALPLFFVILIICCYILVSLLLWQTCFVKNTKTFKMTSTVDSDAINDIMGLN